MSSSHFSFCFFLFLIFLIIIDWNFGIQSGYSNKNWLSSSSSYENTNRSKKLLQESNPSCRKLLVHGTCTNRDISISQSRDSTEGIPQYIVQIINTCTVSSCAPSSIHLNCGWFASARMINPQTFKRLSFDDCLVNGGHPLKNSQIIRFTYSNSFMYSLSFKSAIFC